MSAVVGAAVSPRTLTELAALDEFAHADIVKSFLVTRPTVVLLLRKDIAKSFGPRARTTLGFKSVPLHFTLECL
jgi:hypothetical protein